MDAIQNPKVTQSSWKNTWTQIVIQWLLFGNGLQECKFETASWSCIMDLWDQQIM